MFWKYSFTFLISNFPVCSKLKGRVFKNLGLGFNFFPPLFGPELFFKSFLPKEITLTVHELLAKTDGWKQYGVVVSRSDLVPSLPLQIFPQGQPGLVGEN